MKYILESNFLSIQNEKNLNVISLNTYFKEFFMERMSRLWV